MTPPEPLRLIAPNMIRFARYLRMNRFDVAAAELEEGQPRVIVRLSGTLDACAERVKDLVELLRHRGVTVVPGMVALVWDPCARAPLLSVIGLTDEDVFAPATKRSGPEGPEIQGEIA